MIQLNLGLSRKIPKKALLAYLLRWTYVQPHQWKALAETF